MLSMHSLICSLVSTWQGLSGEREEGAEPLDHMPSEQIRRMDGDLHGHWDILFSLRCVKTPHLMPGHVPQV